MAEDINSSASFGQGKSDNEELPIIVAQRFLNIFRQLHIFSEERRESFNKMLLELPPEVKAIFQTLPGGTPLQEYMEDLEQRNKGLAPLQHHAVKKGGNILQDAISEAQMPGVFSGDGIVNSDNFARILASSLAQSNAEIIREMQNSRPTNIGGGSKENTNISFDGPMKLVADESFTNIISKALSEAIENSERKRLEDNKIIAKSFMDLQGNLSKLIEQNGQIKFIANSDSPGEAVAALQLKGIVDDLVKAQSHLLQETTKNQKEELSSIIATAIKESQKVSTQALIESFQKINEDKGPTPITYAAASPKGQASMESVEQALKAQGKEFSSIISMALKESQKNSAQTIVETLESLKKETQSVKTSQPDSLRIEEIMRMQSNLFRDIARAQNQEFSALISSALKESQRQSTQSIISALSQLQGNVIAAPARNESESAAYKTPERSIPVAAMPAPAPTPVAAPAPMPTATTLQSMAATPMIDRYITSDDDDDDIDIESENESINEPAKKKKKKKKKKNRDNESANETVALSQAAQPVVTPTPAETKPAVQPTVVVEKVQPKPQPVPAEKPVAQATPIVEKPAPQKTTESSILHKFNAAAVEFLSLPQIVDKDLNEDHGWGYGEINSRDSEKDSVFDFDPDINPNRPNDDDDWKQEAVAEDNSEDWEWEYEEVPAEAALGEEGEDWEWEYEEVPAEAAEGEEGEGWEWEYEYEEVPVLAEAEAEVETIDEQETYTDNDILTDQNLDMDDSDTEFVAEKIPYIVLLGLDNEKFRDPYIENNDIIG